MTHAPERAPLRIVIVGGGVAGWMAAAMLARALDTSRQSVTLVEVEGPDQGLGAFGPVEPTLPGLDGLHARLGIDEQALLRIAQGSYALGIAFTGWGQPGETHFHPFGELGAPLGSVAFHHLAGRLAANGRPTRLTDYSLATIAAQLGRFDRPSADPRSVLSTYAYGLHLPRETYAALLRERALALSATRAEAPFARAEIAENGSISRIVTASGELVEGDLFVDCTGPAALLARGTLGSAFDSWKRWLPCDRVAEALADSSAPPAPYAHVAALEAGWSRTVPALTRQSEARIWSSAHVDEAQALGDFPARHITSFEAGRQREAWHRNCIAIGAAAGLVEPLQSTALQLVQSAVARLIALFPTDADGCAEAKEYNRQTSDELDRVRDFVIARYKTNGRLGEPFWDACRAMEVPEPLGWKLDLFASRGRIPLFDGDLFEPSDWVTMLDAQGVRPRRYDPLADAIPPTRIEQHMARLREVILAAAGRLPSHADYLRQRLGGAR